MTANLQRNTYIDAISASEEPIAKVPMTATRKPYTTDAGPPLVYALAKAALVASPTISGG
jgi:hypothetical protein